MTAVDEFNHGCSIIYSDVCFYRVLIKAIGGGVVPRQDLGKFAISKTKRLEQYSSYSLHGVEISVQRIIRWLKSFLANWFYKIPGSLFSGQRSTGW